MSNENEVDVIDEIDDDIQADDVDQELSDTDDANDENSSDEDLGENSEGEDGEDLPALETVEFNGVTYEVPAELAPAIMKNKDYTQKTQTLAEQTKAFEAQQEQFKIESQRSEEDFKLEAQALSLKEQLEPYKDINWAIEQQNDPELAQEHYMRFQELERQKNRISDQQKERNEQRSQEAATSVVKRTEEAEQWALQNLPGWSPQMAQDLFNYATQQEGYTPEEFQKELSPRFLNLLSKAHVGHIAKTKTLQAKAVKKATPTKTVSTKSTGTNQKDVSKMSMEEYAAYRNKQERTKAARATR